MKGTTSIPFEAYFLYIRLEDFRGVSFDLSKEKEGRAQVTVSLETFAATTCESGKSEERLERFDGIMWFIELSIRRDP